VPYDTENGAEIDVFISRPASVSSPEELASSRKRARLLIDTGAKRTAISRKILGEMGLFPIAKTMMKTAGDDVEVGIYHIDLICEYLSPSFTNGRSTG
jgi:predicted aspartyl protease